VDLPCFEVSRSPLGLAFFAFSGPLLDLLGRFGMRLKYPCSESFSRISFWFSLRFQTLPLTRDLPATCDSNCTVVRSAGIESVESPYSVELTISRLETLIRSKGLTLFAHIDHGAGAREAGLQMQPAHVLIFGNARSGTPLMLVRPLLALDLPLKILVWEAPGTRIKVLKACKTVTPLIPQGFFFSI